MTEVQQGPTPRVRFREVSVKRESTVSMRVLIGYSSSGYPVISTGLQNTMDARASNHLYSRVLTDKFTGLAYATVISPAVSVNNCFKVT